MTDTTRRSYYYVSPRGFANELTVYATRRPGAMAVALDRAYGSDINADYGRMSYRSALASHAWAQTTDEVDDRRETVAARITEAEIAGDDLVARWVADDDPALGDLRTAAAGVTDAEAVLVDAAAARDASIRAARSAGQTLAEIAGATGLSAQRVSVIAGAD